MSSQAITSNRYPAPGLRMGDYELVRSIGKGGMGEVFLARDLTLGRRVAVKFLSVDADELLARRFLVEARATARCMHENIVVIHEVSSWQGLPYMVLEYLEGEPLTTLLRRGPLPVGRMIDLLVPVVRALTCAHDAGIIHRDLKPDNILVTQHGAVKVLDFGIARLLAADDPIARRDLATLQELDDGRVVGTAPYMAPEQWEGGEVDGRSDIFAVGVIAYRALTGKHPAGSTEPAILEAAARDRMHAYHPLATVSPAVPAALAAVIDRCLYKHREQRFQTAAELLRALESQRPRERPWHGTDSNDGCPYPGLACFTEADADRFFGRGHETRRAIQMLQSRTVLAVLGQSGSGKSSFALAGVASGLRTMGEGWEVVAHRPGARPLHALVAELRRLEGIDLPADAASVLASKPGQLGNWLRRYVRERTRPVVLVVDQFEEAFTLAKPGAERDAYIAALLGAVDDEAEPLRLVVTMRSDFLQEIASYPELTSAVVGGTLLLTPLDRGGLRSALEGPLERAGYVFEDPNIVGELVAAFDGEDNALPVLQAIATQLWIHRDRSARTIPRVAIEAIGGIGGALARHASGVIAALPKPHRWTAREVFLRLVSAHGTRQVAERATLEGLDANAPLVLKALIDARLVVERDDAATVEIVHEVLITRWPELASWLRSSQDERAARDRIANAAVAWDGQGRPQGMLWSADAVAEADRFAADQTLPAAARAFVAASIAARDRGRRRRRLLIGGGFAIAAAVAIGSTLGLIAVGRAERTATAEARRATEAATAASSAQRALADKVQALEQAEAERAAAAELAVGKAREVESQRQKVLTSEEALRGALTSARNLLSQRDAALAKEQSARADLERALARERSRVKELEKRRSKIFGEVK